MCSNSRVYCVRMVCSFSCGLDVEVCLSHKGSVIKSLDEVAFGNNKTSSTSEIFFACVAPFTVHVSNPWTKGWFDNLLFVKWKLFSFLYEAAGCESNIWICSPIFIDLSFIHKSYTTMCQSSWLFAKQILISNQTPPHSQQGKLELH